MWRCPLANTCLGGNRSDTATCNKGSEGPLCGVCLAGFYNDGNECKTCGDTSSSEFFYGAVLVAAFFVVVAWKWYKSSRVLGGAKLAWHERARSAFVSVIDVQRAKIAWQTIQITTAIAWTTDVEWPQPFKLVSDVLTTISELSLIPIDCLGRRISYWDELLVATILPLAVVALVWLVAMLVPPEYSPRKKATSFTLLLAFVVLPMSATKVFRTFICLDFDDDQRFLESDLSISCDGELYTMMRTYASFSVLLFPCGIPLGFMAILRANRAAISSRDMTQPCPPELRQIAILFVHYQPESMYWEVVECVRRLLLSSVVVFMGRTSLARTVWGALLAIFFAVLCGEVQPCLNPTTQAFAFLTQWHVAVHFLLAAILSAGVNIFSPSTIGTLFVILTAAVIFGAFAHGLNSGASELFHGARRPVKTQAEPCVMICDPGRTNDSEMALVVLRVLRDLGHIKPKAVIANLWPQHDRARNLRKKLDSLGLHDVPVGVGSNGGMAQNATTDGAAHGEEPLSAGGSSEDRANEIGPGGRLLEMTWEEAAPASIVLLLTSSIKVSACF